MFRKLLRSTPLHAAPSVAPQTATVPQKKAPAPPPPTDRFEGPENPPWSSMPPAGTQAVMHALTDLVQHHPGDPVATDYQQHQRVQAALETCVPWFTSTAQDDRPDVAALLRATQPIALSPETAGLLATVLQVSSLIAIPRRRRFLGTRGGPHEAAHYAHVTAQLSMHPGMAPFSRMLATSCDATVAIAQQGKAAMHGCMFECYMGLLNQQDPEPTWEEIAFIQQALIVLSAMNVDAVYKVRSVKALADVPPPRTASHPAGRDTDWIARVHYRIGTFIKCQGGMGLGPGLCWTLGEALTAACREPHMLSTLFALDPWPYRAVRAATPKHETPPRIDLQSHLMGTMYHAVLHHIHGYNGSGWRRRNARAPLDVERHRDFLGHVFSELHRAVMSMPTGWLPAQQLQELHQVAQDSVAQDCDPFTLRARLQGYASTAAASPKLGDHEESEANHIAEGWEAFKKRLYTDEMPLTPPAPATS